MFGAPVLWTVGVVGAPWLRAARPPGVGEGLCPGHLDSQLQGNGPLDRATGCESGPAAVACDMQMASLGWRSPRWNESCTSLR